LIVTEKVGNRLKILNHPILKGFWIFDFLNFCGYKTWIHENT